MEYEFLNRDILCQPRHRLEDDGDDDTGYARRFLEIRPPLENCLSVLAINAKSLSGLNGPEPTHRGDLVPYLGGGTEHRGGLGRSPA